MYQLQTCSWLPLKRPDVFAFFADASNLESLTPPFLHFSVITSRPIEMRQGQLIDYRLRLHGLPIRWRTEITGWEPPFRFEDCQLKGPYSLWVHSHIFEELDGGTLVRDVVRYATPGGRLVHSLFVKRDLRRIFEYRQDRLPELLGVEAASCDRREVRIRRIRVGSEAESAQTETARHRP
jgi:ligand-binding SRPBCC domain-containing protein